MEEENSPVNIATERGLLDLSVTLSTRDITAGDQFALFVLVRNPFDKPVWVRRVHVSLPSELKLADPLETKEKLQKKINNNSDDTHKKRLQDEIIRQEEQRLKLEAKINILETRLTEIFSQFKDDSDKSSQYNEHQKRIEEMLQKLRSDLFELEDNKKWLHIYGEPNIGNIRLDSNLPSGFQMHIYGEPNIGSLDIYDSNQVAQESVQTRTIALESSLPSYAALQPGSTAVYTAVLYVKSSFIFSPSQYRLQFNVIYSFKPMPRKPNQEVNLDEEVLSTNTIAHEISIRPSVTSIIVGSAAGGFVGSIARFLQTNPSLAWQSLINVFLVPLFLSVMLSAIAIIFLARKADEQSFISVEDFWGGLLVGFLIGYTGASFFEKLTGIARPAS